MRCPDSKERKKMNILVHKARKHDKEAFTELMENNGKSMYRVAKAILKNDDDVADAMQETALTCWEKIDTLKNDAFFKTWVIRILINKCNVIFRQRKSYASNANLPETAIWEEDYNNVEWRELLKYLDEKYRTVIILYYVEGFKVREIAKILELSESAIKGRMATARQKMERFYQSEGGRKII